MLSVQNEDLKLIYYTFNRYYKGFQHYKDELISAGGYAIALYCSGEHNSKLPVSTQKINYIRNYMGLRLKELRKIAEGEMYVDSNDTTTDYMITFFGNLTQDDIEQSTFGSELFYDVAAELDEDEFSAVMLTVVEEYTHTEVGNRMGINSRRVAYLKERGLTKLKRIFKTKEKYKGWLNGREIGYSF